MAEIIDINEKNISKEQIGEYASLLEGLAAENEDMMNSMAALFALEDKDFEILAPGILQSFQQSINNPNDRLVLVQTLAASGGSLEQVMEMFTEINSKMDEIDDSELSQCKKDFFKQMFGAIINAINETQGISKRYIEVPFELCHPEAKIPQYANTTDSGMDVYSIDDFTIAPGETKLIPTGLKVAIPVGYELQVRPKSGRALKTKLRIANTPGTIDAGYRDEIGIIVENIEAPIKDISYHFNDDGKIILDSILHGSDYTIGKGEKFCQLVLAETPKVAAYRVEKVGEIGENRGGGFGSTGLK